MTTAILPEDDPDVTAAVRSYTERLRASMVPINLHAGIIRYAVHHIAPGSFLTALLRGDPIRAYALGAPDSQVYIWQTVLWMINHLPGGIWGTPQKFEEWVALRPQAVNGVKQVGLVPVQKEQ